MPLTNVTRRMVLRGALAGGIATMLGGFALAADEVLKPGTERPADAVVLFDGKDTSQWEPIGGTMWGVEDGAMIDDANDIRTKQKFTDYQLHLEFNEPVLGPEFKGQDRGNSGVYQQGRYELQVLDSYHNDTYADGACAAVYGIKAPLKNVAKPPGEWQTYDITFHAAKWDGDKKVTNATITVYWNGELVQDKTEIPHSTGGGAKEENTPGPIRLQWHHHHLKFRNIWIVPIKE
jgi:3-keto-disaccharide hydrolase